ncbi:MAG: potassium transporter Trk [Thaumarchaeota archaeon]|nr:potassium transporter Trk [Nitrososphaerota archaeon]
MDHDVILLDHTSTIMFASRIMKRREDDSVIVVNAGKPVGIVTDQDIIDNLATKGMSHSDSNLEMIMSSSLITILPGAKLKEALKKMQDSHVKKLIVIEDDMVKGMIRQSTIANAIRNAIIVKPRGVKPGLKSVLGNLGFMLQFAGILIMIPAVVAMFLNEATVAASIFLMSVALLTTGFFLNSYGEKAPLNIRQASVLVLSSFLLLSIFGMIPYLYLNPYNTTSISELVVDSFFSSTSGFTTGGISLITTPEDLPQSFRFYRAFTQWVGGMSFIYLVMTAFYPEGKLTGMRGFITGKTLRLRELFLTITMIFGIYVAIVSFLFYIFGAKNIIDDISLALTTVVTGGFLPSSTILFDMEWYKVVVLIGGMILGALPFTFHYSMIKPRLTLNVTREVTVFMIIVVFSIIAIPFIIGIDYLTGIFYAVSAITTAGLQVGSIAEFNEGTKIFLMLLMFIGGCGFSTAGGVKIFRFINLVSLFKKISNIETRRKMTKKDAKELTSIVIILSLFPLISYCTALHIMGQGFTFTDAYFESVAALTTGGLSVGVTSIGLDLVSKIMLALNMILGRFEIIAIIYIIVPRLMP